MHTWLCIGHGSMTPGKTLLICVNLTRGFNSFQCVTGWFIERKNVLIEAVNYLNKQCYISKALYYSLSFNCASLISLSYHVNGEDFCPSKR